MLRMDKRHTDFLIRISCNEKSVNLWRGGIFAQKGALQTVLFVNYFESIIYRYIGTI